MKYYRTNEEGMMLLWKRQADIPKGLTYDEMEVPVDKDGLHAILSDLLARLYDAEREVKILKLATFETEDSIRDGIYDQAEPSVVVPKETVTNLIDLWDNLSLLEKLDLTKEAVILAQRHISTESRNILNDALYQTKGHTYERSVPKSLDTDES